jgi:predicted nucleotidyltransferase
MDRHTREALFVAIREATVVAYGERLISLAVFGSWARGTATPASDLDLLVVAEPLPHASARIPADTLQRRRILGLQA